ncbi:hypothetical protein [Ruegeria sp.]|uniref:hypothetical protein n=1 Tax=Ruegeria sp. TaxID=1879320 RepID=UPI003AFFCCA1
MNMGEEVSHLKAHVNTFYNNGALQRASEQPHLKTNQKPSQINKKVGSQGQGGRGACGRRRVCVQRRTQSLPPHRWRGRGRQPCAGGGRETVSG